MRVLSIDVWTVVVPTPMDPGLGCELDLEALPRYTREHQNLQ